MAQSLFPSPLSKVYETEYIIINHATTQHVAFTFSFFSISMNGNRTKQKIKLNQIIYNKMSNNHAMQITKELSSLANQMSWRTEQFSKSNELEN